MHLVRWLLDVRWSANVWPIKCQKTRQGPRTHFVTRTKKMAQDLRQRWAIENHKKGKGVQGSMDITNSKDPLHHRFFGQQDYKKNIEKKGHVGWQRVGCNEGSDCVSNSDDGIRRQIITALVIQRQRADAGKIWLAKTKGALGGVVNRNCLQRLFRASKPKKCYYTYQCHQKTGQQEIFHPKEQACEMLVLWRVLSS